MARTTNDILNGFSPSLTLDRYQEIMHLPINAFNGLNDPDEYVMEQCSAIWTQSSRNLLAQFMAVAEEMRERELNYHLAPKYIEDEEHEWTDGLVLLDRKHLIEIGSPATSVIEEGYTLTHRTGNTINDPVTISIATSLTNTSEICVFYPGEDVRITPSSISISGGTLTIRIPRGRLVKPDLLDDRQDHLQYDDDTNFLETVDVKRCYTEPSTGVEFVWNSFSLARFGFTCTPGCEQEVQAGCGVIQGERSKRIAQLHTFPATWSNGTPTGTHFRYNCKPNYVRVSYKSGIRNSPEQEIKTARLAHTLMSAQPCTCPLVDQYWSEDRVDSKQFTPYGNMMGALNAWITDSRAKVGTGGIFK